VAITLTVLASAWAAAAPAAGRIDFTGTWTLDVGHSDFGQVFGTTPPTARVDVVRHRGRQLRDAMTVTKPGDVKTTTFDYVLDGRDQVMRVGGQEIHYVGKWQGDTLEVDSQARMMMLQIDVRERWSLSRDGRALTLTRHIKSPLGPGDQTLRFGRTAGVASPPGP
jgi:hypothetical protein